LDSEVLNPPVHRIVDKNSFIVWNKNFCPGVFLNVLHAFDRVWHTGLLFKLKKCLPVLLLVIQILSTKPLISRPTRRLHHILIPNPSRSTLRKWLISRPLQYLHSWNSKLQKYIDSCLYWRHGNSLMTRVSSHSESTVAQQNLQAHLDDISKWSPKCKIKINSDKSFHILFTLRKGVLPVICFQNKQILSTTQTEYFGPFLDKRLTWGPHLKRKQRFLTLDLIYYALFSSLSSQSTTNY